MIRNIFLAIVLATGSISASGSLTQQARIQASDGAPYDWFGRTVSISGSTAVVGTPLDDDKGLDSGAAYVFVRSGGQWVQQAKLVPSDGVSGDGFGAAVAIAGDTILIGSFLDDDRGEDSGSAYVFFRSAGAWSQQAKLTSAQGKAGELFGWSVALLGDLAVIGATEGSDGAAGPGAAYIFERGGAAWSQTARLQSGAPGDQFGFSVVAGEKEVVIGAPDASSGAAYLYRKQNSQWQQAAKLTPGELTSQFGASIAKYGSLIAVGAPGDDARGEDAGAIYVFGATGSTWTQQARLTSSSAAPGDALGSAVALAGSIVLGGAPGADLPSARDSGALYTYIKGAAGWIEEARSNSSDTGEGHGFAFALAATREMIASGAFLANLSQAPPGASGTQTGASYLFDQAMPSGLAVRNNYNNIEAAAYGAPALTNAFGIFGSDPGVAAGADGDMYIVARDTYGGLWLNSFRPLLGLWAEWWFLGGWTQGQPEIAVTSAGGIWVAVRDSWKAVWLARFEPASRALEWLPLGGVFGSDPKIAACPDGSFYLVGKDTYGALWSGRYQAPTGQWSGWNFGGGITKGEPSAVCGADGALYIAVRDTYDGLWMARGTGLAWTGWFFTGGRSNSDPQASATQGLIYVTLLDHFGALWYNSFAEGAANGWQSWVFVGGALADIGSAAANGNLIVSGRTGDGDLWWWRKQGNQWSYLGLRGATKGRLGVTPR